MLHSAVAALTLVSAIQGVAIGSAEELISAMHARYAGKAAHTLIFEQHNTRYLPDGSLEHSTWFERASNPGQLRIVFAPADSGSGVIYANDSQYSFEHDRLVDASPFIHPLMVMGTDVAFLPVEATLRRIRGLGYDLGIIHVDTWQGHAVYVVGATAGDLHTKQFWVDKDRLILVRTLEPGRRDSTKTLETQLNHQQQLAGGWIETETLVLVDGKPRWREEYSDVRVDSSSVPTLFDPRTWNRMR